MVTTVIFDMDGVICHTNPYHSKAFKVFFERRGLSPTEEEFKQHMYGKNNSYILSHFLGRKIQGEELLILEEEKEALFREIYQSQVDPIPGFIPFIEKLIKHNTKLGVATSAPQANMQLILNALDIQELFLSKLASEDVTEHKPNPEVYLKSLHNLKSSAEHTLIFEDSYSGITAGLNANCRVVGVLSSHTASELPKASHYINDYTDVALASMLV